MRKSWRRLDVKNHNAACKNNHPHCAYYSKNISLPMWVWKNRTSFDFIQKDIIHFIKYVLVHVLTICFNKNVLLSYRWPRLLSYIDSWQLNLLISVILCNIHSLTKQTERWTIWSVDKGSLLTFNLNIDCVMCCVPQVHQSILF